MCTSSFAQLVVYPLLQMCEHMHSEYMHIHKHVSVDIYIDTYLVYIHIYVYTHTCMHACVQVGREYGHHAGSFSNSGPEGLELRAQGFLHSTLRLSPRAGGLSGSSWK